MSKKFGRSDKKKMSMSEESRQTKDDISSSSRRVTRSSKSLQSTPQTTDPPLSSSRRPLTLRADARTSPTPTDPQESSSSKKSPLLGIFSRKSLSPGPESSTQTTSRRSLSPEERSTLPRASSPSRALSPLMKMSQDIGRFLPSGDSQTRNEPPSKSKEDTSPRSSPTRRSRSPFKKMSTLLRRVLPASDSKTKTKEEAESSGTKEATRSPSKRTIRFADQPTILGEPQTPEKKMRTTPLIAITNPDASVTRVYRTAPPEQNRDTADRSEEEYSSQQTTSQQPFMPTRHRSNRTERATSRFLADTLSTLTFALREVERKPPEQPARLFRCEDGKFVVVEATYRQNNPRLKQYSDRLRKKFEKVAAGHRRRQVGDEQQQPSTQSTSASEDDIEQLPASTESDTDQMRTESASVPQPAPREVRIEFRDRRGEPLCEVSVSYSSRAVDLTPLDLSNPDMRDLWTLYEVEDPIPRANLPATQISGSSTGSEVSATHSSFETLGATAASAMDVAILGSTSRRRRTPNRSSSSDSTSSTTSSHRLDVIDENSSSSSDYK